MHGFGVRPCRVGGDVGLDHVGVEVVAEVEHEVVDAELLGDAAGVVDVGHRAAAGVAVAAPQLHRHADDVVTGVDQSAAATDESTPPLSATSTFTRPVPCRRRTTESTIDRRWRRSTSAAVVVRPSDSRSAPRARSVGHAHGGEHVRRLHRAAGARRRRAGAHAGLVEQEQQRLALDAVDADVGRAGDLARAVDRLVDVVETLPQAVDEPVAQLGDARASRSPARCRWRAAPRPWRRCRRRCACRCAARAPGRRRRAAARTSCRRAPPARRRPSGRRTCAPTATAGRRAA